MIRKTSHLQFASRFPFYYGLLIAALLTIPSITDAQEPQPIEIRRVVIDLELAKVVAVNNKTKKDDELASYGTYNGQYSQAFQSQNNFYSNTLKEYIEEERRLFYVACTRAIDKLVIEYDKEKPSKFITELFIGQESHKK